MRTLRRHRWIAALSVASLLCLSLITGFHHHDHDDTSAHEATQDCTVCLAASQLSTDTKVGTLRIETAPPHFYYLVTSHNHAVSRLQQSPFNSRAPPHA